MKQTIGFTSFHTRVTAAVLTEEKILQMYFS